MRRSDREVKEKKEIYDILNRCETIRIGINQEKYPYVVPVSFAAEITDGSAVIFFHCAAEGLKADLLKANPFVCVEGDILIRTEKTAHGITARYESVIGFGECSFVDDRNEAIRALKAITAHYGYCDYPVEKCFEPNRMLVGKIVLSEIYGKRNLPV